MTVFVTNAPNREMSKNRCNSLPLAAQPEAVEAGLLAHDEEAVNHARGRGRLGGREDEQRLIGVGDQHLLALG